MIAGPVIYPPHPLTYEQYMTEDVVKRRYDIINGVRVFAVPPSIRHQCLVGNIQVRLNDYGGEHNAFALHAPFDVLVSLSPFCTRQPDVMLVSEERWRQHGPDDGRPLTVVPELVVEILSSVDRELALENKLRDYGIIGVQEVWVVRSDEQTIEVVRVSEDEIESVGTFGRGQTVTPLTFPGLQIAVDDVFAV